MLRLPSVRDAEAIFSSYAQDSEVTRFLRWRPHKDIHETECFLANCAVAWEGNVRFPYVITRKDCCVVVGMIEVRVDEFKADVGYVISRENWGQGIATEALRSLVAWALGEDSIYRVWALCDVENPASGRVLEKVGMRREGMLRRQMIHPNVSDAPRDCYCYAVVK